MDRWQHWSANQRTSRGSVVVGRAGGGGARPSGPEAVLVWAAATKQNSGYTRSGLIHGRSSRPARTDVLRRRTWGASAEREAELLQRGSELQYENDDYQMSGVAQAVADRTGHCTKSRTAEDNVQNRYSPLLAQCHAVG